jgi:hypothetical protein
MYEHGGQLYVCTTLLTECAYVWCGWVCGRQVQQLIVRMHERLEELEQAWQDGAKRPRTGP